MNNSQEYKELIEKLIQKNQTTQGKKPWHRFFTYDIDVSLVMNFQTMEPKWSLQEYYKYPEFARSGVDRKINVMFSLIYGDGTRWTFKIPLQYLIKGWGNANEGHQCYSHCIKLSGMTDMLGEVVPNESKEIERCYSGITKRNWLLITSARL